VLVLEPREVERFAAAFESGFFIQPESVRAVFKPPHQFNVLDEQSALKADFWLLRENAFEQAAFARRAQVNLFGVSTWIATAEDVILHKLFWNKLTPSDRQVQDAAGVYAVQGKALDTAYLDHWAPVIGVERDWMELAQGRLKPRAT
jgi:hypothetical protein